MATRVATINGRVILALPPMGHYANPWFLVEVGYGVYSTKQDTLADAEALATHLGALTEPDMHP